MKKNKISCVVCGGKIVDNLFMDLVSISISGIAADNHFREAQDGYRCEDCGIHYDALPDIVVVKRLNKEREEILRMNTQTRKKLDKKLNKIQANLNYNKRMK